MTFAGAGDFARPCVLRLPLEGKLSAKLTDEVFYERDSQSELDAAGRFVIELDGSQHYKEQGIRYDRTRDWYLESLGLTVLRYSNLDVKQNFSGVCQDILRHLPEAANTSSVTACAVPPSPQGEG